MAGVAAAMASAWASQKTPRKNEFRRCIGRVAS
jgi:hypothetical protein